MVGPQFGVTHNQILQAAGASVVLTGEEAGKRIRNLELGWAYLDHSQCVPSLFGLPELRM